MIHLEDMYRGDITAHRERDCVNLRGGWDHDNGRVTKEEAVVRKSEKNGLRMIVVHSDKRKWWYEKKDKVWDVCKKMTFYLWKLQYEERLGKIIQHLLCLKCINMFNSQIFLCCRWNETADPTLFCPSLLNSNKYTYLCSGRTMFQLDFLIQSYWASKLCCHYQMIKPYFMRLIKYLLQNARHMN